MRNRYLILLAVLTYASGMGTMALWTRREQAASAQVGGVYVPTSDECVDAIMHYAKTLGRIISPDTLIEQERRKRNIGGRVLCAVATECYGPGLDPIRLEACAAMDAEYPVGWQWMVEECEPCRN